MPSDDFDLDSEVQSTITSSPLSFLDPLEISNDVKRRLSGYLKSLLPGGNDIYITPLGDNLGPDNILHDWDVIFQSNKSRMNEALLDLESSNRSKFGPRSIRKSWVDRSKSVAEYFEFSKAFNLNNPPILSIGSNRLRPLSIARAVSYLKNNTNSGLPYYMPKRSIKPKILNMDDVTFKSKLDKSYPCILFTRTQEGNKTRDVWGYPIFDTIQETRYYVPVLDFQRKLKWRSALSGPDSVSRSITEMLFKCKRNPDLILVSVDFSGFDRSVLPEASSLAFEYIKSLFRKDYHEEIDRICERFQTIGLVTPSGIFTGYHGVPSGSTFTNEVDSLVQYLITTSSGLIMFNLFQIQGDDGVYLIKRQDYEKFIKALEQGGLTVNVSKSYSSDNYCVYLQNLYHSDYVGDDGIIGGIYPTYRALCRIIYQERFANFLSGELEGRDYYSIRTIGILENCKHHPLFEDLVKFIYYKDKYRLAFSDSALNKYVNFINNAPGTGGVLNNQYSDNVSGINSFETMKIIKSLA